MHHPIFLYINQNDKSNTCSSNYIVVTEYVLRNLFIRLSRKPSLPVGMDECVKNRPKMKYCCYGGCRLLQITLRSIGVGGYFME